MVGIKALFLTFGYLSLCWGIPVLMILSLTYICRNSERALDSTFGAKAEIYAGFIGIMIHETSHFLLALLFKHKIIKIKLLVLPWNVDMSEEHPKLGYVNHAYSDHSLYQVIGNAFIGTAPVYGCTAVLYLIYRYMTPNLFNLINNTINQIWSQPSSFDISSFCSSLLGLMKFDISSIGITLLAFYLITNITLTGFDLSNADLKNSLHAGIGVLILLAFIIFPFCYFGMEAYLNYYILGFVMWFLPIFTLSLFNAILVNLGCNVFRFFGNLG